MRYPPQLCSQHMLRRPLSRRKIMDGCDWSKYVGDLGTGGKSHRSTSGYIADLSIRCTGGCTGWCGGGVRAGVSGAMGARPWAGLGLESTRNPDCQFRWQYAHRSSLAGALDIAQTIIPNPTFNGLLSAGSSRFSGMSALTLFWPTHETRREIKRESRSLGGPSSSAVGSLGQLR